MAERTLAITSSTAVVGVAIARGDQVLAFEQITTERRHAEEITPMVQRVLAEAGLCVADIDRLAVDVGPGRFTGLRVGLATIRTLAFALKIPVVGVSSLEILAAGTSERPVMAVIDARRGEVFQQRFDVNGATADPLVGPAADLAARGEVGDIIVGDGADRYHDHYGSGVRIGVEPSAAVLAVLAHQREAIEGHLVEPKYLRDADVQINIKTRHNS
ncbi:MAG: tRNA (adenosine(37)-N6)-threonylcarbamoyltransferase complex dimerization subunit type 1 TsaB [Acidimicrobiales bacterium]